MATSENQLVSIAKDLSITNIIDVDGPQITCLSLVLNNSFLLIGKSDGRIYVSEVLDVVQAEDDFYETESQKDL